MHQGPDGRDLKPWDHRAPQKRQAHKKGHTNTEESGDISAITSFLYFLDMYGSEIFRESDDEVSFSDESFCDNESFYNED